MDAVNWVGGRRHNNLLCTDLLFADNQHQSRIDSWLDVCRFNSFSFSPHVLRDLGIWTQQESKTRKAYGACAVALAIASACFLVGDWSLAGPNTGIAICSQGSISDSTKRRDHF